MKTDLLVVAMAGIALAGCVAHSTIPVASQSLENHQAQATIDAPAFAYEVAEVPFRNHVLEAEETPTYRVRHIRFPSVGDNGQPGNLVEGMYHESKLPGAKPTIIVLPIWGGHVYPAEKMTDFISNHSSGGVNIFMMLGKNFLFDWQALGTAPDEEAFLAAWRRSAQREETMLIDIRRTIDWAQVRPEVDPDRIGILGFSHGAIAAAAVTIRDPRIGAAVLMMPGALIHEVLARCPLGRSEKMRAHMTSAFGWTISDLEAELEPIFRPLDPATYPGLVDPSRVLMIDANKDECMPEAGREALWQALGQPERIRLPYKHQRAFLAMTPVGFNWLRYRIWDFFEESFINPVQTVQ